MAPFFLHAVAPEDLHDLSRGGDDASSHESRSHLLCIEANDGPVNDLGQHLDDQRRVDHRIICSRPLRGLVALGATTSHLGLRALSVGADVQVLTLEALTIDAPTRDEVRESVVDPHMQAELQLAVEQPGVGRVDEASHRLLEGAVTREADPCVLPEAFPVELRHVAERVEATIVAVAREVADRRQPSEDRHARASLEGGEEVLQLGRAPPLEQVVEHEAGVIGGRHQLA